MSETHLSQQAYDRLVAELEERSTTRRREISALIEKARELGDLSENADYDAAKNEQGHNEARIRHIEALLKQAVVVTNTAADVVSAGCVVELRFDDEDDTVTYLVGSIEERHDEYDMLTTTSPLGRAVLGAAPGDAVSYEGPRGNEIAVEVVSVRPR